MVQRREADRAWVATVCNLEPEPPAIGTMFDLAALAASAARDIRAAWIDAGDGKGYRRWGCDMSQAPLAPGMNEIELLPVDGGPTLDAGMIEVMSFHESSGTVRWEGGGWLAKIVEMELA